MGPPKAGLVQDSCQDAPAMKPYRPLFQYSGSLYPPGRSAGGARLKERTARAGISAAALVAIIGSTLSYGSVQAQAAGQAGAQATPPRVSTPASTPSSPPASPQAAATPAPASAISPTPRRERAVVTQERDQAALAAARVAITRAPGPVDAWGLSERDWDWMSADLLVRKARVGARSAEVRRAAEAGDPRAQLLLAYWLSTPERIDIPAINDLYQRAADSGFPRGRVGLSWTFFAGFGRPVDPQRAHALCEELVETGYTRAMSCAASSHQTGVGAPRDSVRTTDLLLRAASLGAPSAMLDLAWLYIEGKDVERNMDRARAWIDLAVETGDQDTKAEAAGLLIFRPGPLQDVERGLVLAREAAEAGSASGMIQLAVAYRNGLIGDPDDERGLELLKQAAADGDGFAMFMIGSSYLFGEDGLEEDPEQALTWFEQAVVFGSNRARGFLGAILLRGYQGIEADPRRAIPILRAAVEAGDEQAMISLGVAYESGIAGVETDPEQAVALYRRAHEAESTTGTFFLANMAAGGAGMNEDPGLARALWREAAEKDHVDAMLALASALAAGYGGPVDTQEALTWAERARESGDTRQRVAARRLIRAIEEVGVRDGST